MELAHSDLDRDEGSRKMKVILKQKGIGEKKSFVVGRTFLSGTFPIFWFLVRISDLCQWWAKDEGIYRRSQSDSIDWPSGWSFR